MSCFESGKHSEAANCQHSVAGRGTRCIQPGSSRVLGPSGKLCKAKLEIESFSSIFKLRTNASSDGMMQSWHRSCGIEGQSADSSVILASQITGEGSLVEVCEHLEGSRGLCRSGKCKKELEA